ncbi:hypothetical protein L8T12_21510 [Enterobacter roggenkampii]|uniref:hypothetical protein n=1 Tax=Enterobacter roggenkampii TaxID=1812935 RepID=UPI0020069F5C|nr:hypothetical protein [Enterobacter roggenkampii]MCK6925415.1 hypothetical protein [Enterobacter roggenkampii]
MTANKPMTGKQLDELMTVAVNMQRDAETDCNRPSAMFAYAVQVAVLELRKVRNDAAALAAENAGLKELIEQHANSVAVCPNCSHEEPSETDDIVALYRTMETPATDAFLAEVRAQGAEMFAAYCGEENSVFVEAKAYYRSLPDAAYEFAAQLRQEAAQ